MSQWFYSSPIRRDPHLNYINTHTPQTTRWLSQPVFWGSWCVICLWKHVYLFSSCLPFLSCLMHSYCALLFKVVWYPLRHPWLPLRLPICNAIFAAYYWDTLLWRDTASQQITRPWEVVRPLNIRRNVNKQYLMPGCSSYNTHTRTDVWLRDMISQHSIFFAGEEKKTLILCSTTTSLSEKLMYAVWPHKLFCVLLFDT